MMFRRVVLGLGVSALILASFSILRPQEPAPELIRLAVRATLHAMPTATPYMIEVTRVVEVTSTPAATASSTPQPTSTETPPPTLTPTGSPTQTADPEPVAQAAAIAPVRVDAEAALVAPEDANAEPQPPEPVTNQGVAHSASSGCPVASDRTYDLIPVAGGGLDHPHDLHGDLNLSLRGYVPVDAVTTLVEINGPTDGDAPQLAGVLPGSEPQIVRAYQVNQWDWSCGAHGCRGGGPVPAAVSLIGLAASPGAPVSIPSRQAQVYGGGYVALVLYAEENRLTLVYTREDSVANGYSVHLESYCVDPALLAAYRAAHTSGRRSLPAVRNGEIVGVALGNEVGVAVRDRGAFGDPRSRKDWWR